MKPKVNPFLGTVRALAIAMSNKTGLKIRFEGTKAKTDGSTIWLPADLPFDDETIVTKVRGYVDHEASHVEMTDFDLPKPDSPLIHTLTNIIEDIRIEKEKGIKFPGCAVNFKRLIDVLVTEEKITPPAKFLEDPKKSVLAYLSYGARTLHLRHNLQEISEAWREKVVEQYGETTAKTVNLAIKEIGRCVITADARELAEEVFKHLQEPPEPEPEPQPQPEPESEPDPNGESQKGDEEQKDEGKSDDSGDDTPPTESEEPNTDETGGPDDTTGDDEGKDQGQPGAESSEPTEEDEGSKTSDDTPSTENEDPDTDETGGSDATSGDEEGKEQGQPDAESSDSTGEGDNKDQDEDQAGGDASGSKDNNSSGKSENPGQNNPGEKGEGSSDASDGGDTNDSAGQQQSDSTKGGFGTDTRTIEEIQAIEELVNASEEDLDQAAKNTDLSAIVEESIDGEQGQEDLNHLNTDGCTDTGLVSSEKSTELMEITPEIQEMADMCRNTSGLRAKMAGLFQSTKLKRDNPQLVGHRIDRRAVHRIAAMTPDTRFFQSRRDKVDKNTAITILVDKSGSMWSKIILALASALSIVKALESMPGMCSSVAAYPYGDNDGVLILKDFNEKSKTGRFAISVSGGTPTATALRWAGQNIWPRLEKRKIVLALFDGEPDNPEQAAAMVQLLRENGIEVYSIGIGAETGQKCANIFGEECFLEIENINELGDAMFTTLTNVLTRKAA